MRAVSAEAMELIAAALLRPLEVSLPDDRVRPLSPRGQRRLQRTFLCGLGACAGTQTVRALLGFRGAFLQDMAELLHRAAASAAESGELSGPGDLTVDGDEAPRPPASADAQTNSPPEPMYDLNITGGVPSRADGGRGVGPGGGMEPHASSSTEWKGGEAATAGAAEAPTAAKASAATERSGGAAEAEVVSVFSTCSSCGQKVLARNMVMHEAHCARRHRQPSSS